MTLAARRHQRSRTRSESRRLSAEGRQALRRAMAYLKRYPRLVALGYGSLFLALAAQLAVPQLVQQIIDTITVNAGSKDVLALPPAMQAAASTRLGLDPASLQVGLDRAPQALLAGMLLIVLLATVRGLLSYSQNYVTQTLSHNIAFEFRNDLFAKIQRLSFSYHDRQRTGQLMIRATDDVEKLRLFILDDSTSSVDLQAEAQIQQALERLMKGQTSFVIARRLSTVARADQILVLDQGQIVASGRHRQLLEESPIFAEIYHSQLQ